MLVLIYALKDIILILIINVGKIFLYFFKKIEDEYKCVTNCWELFISSIGECVEQCKFGENYIGKNKKLTKSINIYNK